MARYSNNAIRRLLQESDTAHTADEKGDKLEELVRYLFDKVPGVTFFRKNALDGIRAHELDVVFKNDRRKSHLHFLSYPIITECKNTTHPLGSAGVRWFIDKLRDCGVADGVLISLSGITGGADGRTSAHSEVLSGVGRDGIRVLILSRTEIEPLTTTDELVDLLQEKILQLTVDRTVG